MSLLCEGFRMPALTNGSSHTGAGVRKPPGKEPARDGHPTVPRYGDLVFVAGAAIADVGWDWRRSCEPDDLMRGLTAIAMSGLMLEDRC